MQKCLAFFVICNAKVFQPIKKCQLWLLFIPLVVYVLLPLSILLSHSFCYYWDFRVNKSCYFILCSLWCMCCCRQLALHLTIWIMGIFIYSIRSIICSFLMGIIFFSFPAIQLPATSVSSSSSLSKGISSTSSVSTMTQNFGYFLDQITACQEECWLLNFPLLKH